MTFPTSNESTAHGAAPPAGTVNDHVTDRNHVKLDSKGPGSVEADLGNKADFSLDTKLGKIGINVDDPLDAKASTQAPGGVRLDVRDNLKVRAVLHRDELDVYVRDHDRVRATAKGPLDLSVKDGLGVTVDAPPDVKVVLKVRESDRVIARASRRPEFLERAGADKAWQV